MLNEKYDLVSFINPLLLYITAPFSATLFENELFNIFTFPWSLYITPPFFVAVQLRNIESYIFIVPRLLYITDPLSDCAHLILKLYNSSVYPSATVINCL